MSSDSPILVTGAGGFIGKDLVFRLLRHGFHVRAMVRSLAGSSTLSPHERLQIVQADMRDQSSLDRAVLGCAAVVHLAAAKADEIESEDINVGGARRLVRACAVAGIRRVINISTQSTKVARRGIYARTKLSADEVLHGSGLNVTSLLPSVVYGESMGGVFGTIRQFVQKAPVVVVLGNGKWLSAPVYAGDVSAAVIACLETPLTIAKSYDIGGPDLVSFDDLIDRIGAAIGRQPPKLHVPFSLALVIAHVVARLPNAPITVSNVLGSNQHTRIDIEPARRDFGFDPLRLDTGLIKVLGAYGRERSARSTGSHSDERTARLAKDCRLLVLYLTDREPTIELMERYRNATELKLRDPGVDEAEWHCAQRNPRLLPYLDAAAALVRPQSTLRQRIYLMAALLETLPVFSDEFLPRQRKPLDLLASVIWNATTSTVKAAIGLPLLALVRRFR